MIESWRNSPPTRSRRGPARVTSCEQFMTARFSGTGFTARAPGEQRINDCREDNQIDQSSCGYREKRRAAERVTGRARKDVLRKKKRPGVEVKEGGDHPAGRMVRPIDTIDQH